MNILVINAGSSSLKYQLINMDNEAVIAKGMVDRIGLEISNLEHKYDGKKYVEKMICRDHSEAMTIVLDALTDAEHGVIGSIDEIGAVGHRVLHGGMEFTKSCLIDEKCIAAVERCIPLGPLHNPANLQGIRACQAVMPSTPMIAVFDTAFHQTMPPTAYMYPIPYEYYEKHQIRRYGFHGTSHRFVSARAMELLGLGEDSKIIVCHLGNGSSLSACIGGKCVDTSMGLTPLEGVLMGTRSGSIDPAIVATIADLEGLTAAEVVDILNKKSGLLGVSGISSDMRDVVDAAAEGHERSILVLEMWSYIVRKQIGAYIAAMGGVDAIIFTAGIGENDPEYRISLCRDFEYLGMKIDPERNQFRGREGKISTDDSKVQLWVIPTNEELAIARDTLEIAANL